MNEAKDRWTRLIDCSVDILFAKHPARTGLGVVLGCVIAFMIQIFEPSLRAVTFIDAMGAPVWGWIPVGILIMHAPSIVFLVKRKPVGQEALDEVIELIERGNFSASEKRQHYRNLIANAAQRIALTQKTQQEIRALERSMGDDDALSK